MFADTRREPCRGLGPRPLYTPPPPPATVAQAAVASAFAQAGAQASAIAQAHKAQTMGRTRDSEDLKTAMKGTFWRLSLDALPAAKQKEAVRAVENRCAQCKPRGACESVSALDGGKAVKLAWRAEAGPVTYKNVLSWVLLAMPPSLKGWKLDVISVDTPASAVSAGASAAPKRASARVRKPAPQPQRRLGAGARKRPASARAPRPPPSQRRLAGVDFRLPSAGEPAASAVEPAASAMVLATHAAGAPARKPPPASADVSLAGHSSDTSDVQSIARLEPGVEPRRFVPEWRFDAPLFLRALRRWDGDEGQLQAEFASMFASPGGVRARRAIAGGRFATVAATAQQAHTIHRRVCLHGRVLDYRCRIYLDPPHFHLSCLKCRVMFCSYLS